MESLILVIHLKRLLNVIKKWDTTWMLKILFMRPGNSTPTLQMGQQILQAIISVCLCNGIIDKEFYQLAFGFYWEYDICLPSSIYTLWRLFIVLFSIIRVSIRRARILSFTFFVFRDHVFDTSDRIRLAGRQKFSTVSTKKNSYEENTTSQIQ